MYAYIKPHSIHLYTCIFAQKCMQRKMQKSILYLHCALYMSILQLYAGFIGLHQFIFLASGWVNYVRL